MIIVSGGAVLRKMNRFYLAVDPATTFLHEKDLPSDVETATIFDVVNGPEDAATIYLDNEDQTLSLKRPEESLVATIGSEVENIAAKSVHKVDILSRHNFTSTLGTLAAKIRPWQAILASAALFGLFHVFLLGALATPRLVDPISDDGP